MRGREGAAQQRRTQAVLATMFHLSRLHRITVIFWRPPLRSAPTRLLRRASSLNYSIPIHFPIYFHGSFLDRNWMVLLG